jgi:hypothetical protein
MDLRTVCDKLRSECLSSWTPSQDRPGSISFMNGSSHIVFESKMGFHQLMVVYKKRDKFSGYLKPETTFAWHLQNDEDASILINKIAKMVANITDGPFSFSKRSTYAKKMAGQSMAMSGNFITGASVDSVVSIKNNGAIDRNISTPGKDAWFLIKTNTMASSPNRFIHGREMQFLYNLENWWPVDDGHATSVLAITDGRLLTMHDRFVLDLAVKLYNEHREEKR